MRFFLDTTGKMKFLIASIPLLFIYCAAPPADSPSPKAKIFEAYITQMAELGELNGNVLVAEKGTVIYKRSIGRRSAEVGD